MDGYATRSARPEDVAAVVGLQRRWDTHWFGDPEHDESEVREDLGRVDPLETRSLLVLHGDRLVGAAWWWQSDQGTLLVDPDLDPVGVYDELLPWLTASGAVGIEALDRDVVLHETLARHGWTYVRSQFELTRDASGVAPPLWPDGVTTTGLGEHARAVHHLIYDEAGWADVPGHHGREFEEWLSVFVSDDVDPDEQVLAWRGGRLVGVAMGKTFSDGVGWVSQLAVPPDLRGEGLGKALLSEAFGRRVAGGATRLGLGVAAANGEALQLYLGAGLTIDREWMTYQSP